MGQVPHGSPLLGYLRPLALAAFSSRKRLKRSPGLSLTGATRAATGVFAPPFAGTLVLLLAFALGVVMPPFYT
jgi:hypothetical protein